MERNNLLTIKKGECGIKMRNRIVTLILAILFLGIPIFSLIPPVHATTGWGSPTNITNDPNHNDMQSVITQDPIHAKAWHVAWVKEMKPSDLTSWDIFYTNSTGIKVQITNDSNYDWNPMIDMDSKGVVHIVWVRESISDGSQSDIFYANSTNWRKIIDVSRQEKGIQNWQPTLAVDKETGVPHIAWVTIASPTAGIGDIWYRRGVWAPIEQVTYTQGDSREPSIALDSKKNVHVVWAEKGYKTGGTYAIRYTNSTIWPATDTTNYVNVSRFIRQINNRRPDIVIDALNRSHVTYYQDLSNAQVCYTFSPFAANTWFLNPSVVSTTTDKNKYPSIKVSKNANPIIIYQGLKDNFNEIYSIDYNGTWVPTDISNNPYEDSLEWSSIGALDIDVNDALYATYYTDIQSAAGGPSDWEVFVVTGSVGGAGIPGFEFVYLSIIALIAAIIWYHFKRKSTEWPFK